MSYSEFIFTEAFGGTLVTDFWRAYESVVVEDRQYRCASAATLIRRSINVASRWSTAGGAPWPTHRTPTPTRIGWAHGSAAIAIICFTFLDTTEVPFDNNDAERQIRPAVIIRKNSLCNRSDQGAHMQAALMSVYRTLRLRGHDPTQTIASALRQLLQTGTLPPLPTEPVADG